MGDRGLDMMFGLVLESGRPWGEVAQDVQVADATAIFDDERPHLHFLTRPRGGSKSTDIAGVALSWLAVEAPPLSNGHVVASNTDQAAILIDAAAAFVARTPELDGVVTVESERMVGPNGAWVRVLPQSDSGSWGLRDARLLILDEFAQWPQTRGAQRVYTAVRSTVQKVPGCRLIILTSAGEPSHWTYEEVYKRALDDPMWRVSAMPGPVPWQQPEEIEALRRELRPSEFDRLVLNIWSEDEDRAISEEDFDLAAQRCRLVDAGVRGIQAVGMRLHEPGPHAKYVITVDVGTRNDATVMCVAHREPFDPMQPHGAQRVVVDHLERWQGSKKQPVQIRAIEEWLAKTAPFYNNARVYADPDQFVGSVQDLNRRGIRASEWAFTSTSVGQVATALVQVFRNRQIHVPEHPVLRDELLRVRLRETAHGVTRLDHDRAGHDDQAVAIGMACHILLGGRRWGPGAGFVEMMKRQVADRAEAPESPPAPLRQRARRAQAAAARQRQRQARCEHRRRYEPPHDCVLCGAAAEG